MVGWVKIQANDIANLLDEERIGGKLEMTLSLWLESEGMPYAMNSLM